MSLTPQRSTLQLGGNPQHQALPQEQRAWTTDLASQLLWLPCKGLAFKSLNSESPWGCAFTSLLGPHKTGSFTQQFSRLSAEGVSKMPSSQGSY